MICFQANVFNDPTVLKAVQDQLKELKIEIYENYLMDEWHSQGIIDMNQPIEHVIFRAKDKRQGKDLNFKCTVTVLCENISRKQSNCFRLYFAL